MSMSFLDDTIRDFADILASKAAVPGGGGASALVAAVGAALGTMVGRLTGGKKKYADVEPDIMALMEECESLRGELLRAVDDDAEGFEPLSKAYSISRDAPDRDELMEKCLRGAAEVPLRVMRLSARVIELQRGFAEKGSALAVSDAGTGVVFCWAALYGAALNVRVNTRLMGDRDYARGMDAEVKELMDKYWKVAEEIYEGVFERLGVNG
jgi:formiminotetrahydrofolate cyclodeaminase